MSVGVLLKGRLVVANARDQLVTVHVLVNAGSWPSAREPSRSVVSQAGRARSSSSRSSCNVIHCTGFTMAVTALLRGGWRLQWTLFWQGALTRHQWVHRLFGAPPSTERLNLRNARRVVGMERIQRL